MRLCHSNVILWSKSKQTTARISHLNVITHIFTKQNSFISFTFYSMIQCTTFTVLRLIIADMHEVMSLWLSGSGCVPVEKYSTHVLHDGSDRSTVSLCDHIPPGRFVPQTKGFDYGFDSSFMCFGSDRGADHLLCVSPVGLDVNSAWTSGHQCLCKNSTKYHRKVHRLPFIMAWVGLSFHPLLAAKFLYVSEHFMHCACIVGLSCWWRSAHLQVQWFYGMCFLSITISISVCENKQFVKEIIHPKIKYHHLPTIMFFHICYYFILGYTKGEFSLKLFKVTTGRQ